MSTDNTHPDHADAGGFVPRLGADPSSAAYELLTAAQAVDRIAAVGFDRADAQRMVDQYMAVNTAAIGAPPGDGWRVDPYDLTEIARAYDWVDHYQGETIADARARAAQYATDHQHRADSIDREQDPGYAARIDREAAQWAERTRDGHTPWPVPDPAEQEAELRTPEVVITASWALAARDAAIEKGDTEHATRFAHQAREALAATDAAGITREQLAYELDYPGGAAELDGDHIDLGIDNGEPMTAAQLAGLDAAFDDNHEDEDDFEADDVWDGEREGDEVRDGDDIWEGIDGEGGDVGDADGGGAAAGGTGRGAQWEELTRQFNAQWPPERTAAVELARARAELARLEPDTDDNVRAGFEHSVAQQQAQARHLLGLPVSDAEQAAPARARGRADLTGMLDADPEARAGATADVTEQWPADHRDLMRRRAALGQQHQVTTEPDAHDHGHDDEDGRDDGDGGVRGPVDTGPPLPPTDGANTRDDDVDDLAEGRDDPEVVAWWAPVEHTEHTLTRGEVVSELTDRGLTPDRARAAVDEYLDTTSREIGVSVHQWGMDSHDIEAITHTHTAALTGQPMSDPWANAAGPDLSVATKIGPDREDRGPGRDERGPDLPALPDIARHLAAPSPDQVEPTVHEIADLTARLRGLTRRDPNADPAQDAADRAAFIADKEALLARITATDPAEAETSTAHTLGNAEETITHRETAERLTEHGGLDRCDLDAIAAEQRVAAVRDAVTQAGTEPARTSRQNDGTTDQDRRAQLAAWAHADTTDDTDSAEHGMELQR